MAPWIYLAGIVIFVTVYLIVYIIIQNNLIAKKNEIDNAFAGIDVQLKMRYDLIPNLVDTVKGYMQHEGGILTKISELRSKAMGGQVTTDQKIDLNNQLTQTLGSLRVMVENYPDLKANQNFEMLSRTLNETEAQIAAARRAYNSAVTDFNNAIEQFPSSTVAKKLGYTRKVLFEAQVLERENVSVGKAFNK